MQTPRSTQDAATPTLVHDSQARLRCRLADALAWRAAADDLELEIISRSDENGFRREEVRYSNPDGERVPAFLLTPLGGGPFPGVVVYHQHNDQWHLGKSEVAGLAGEPMQAFGPALARRGFVVLAPDAIGFEDRRRNGSGREPRTDDREQYYNEMAYRLVQGRLLMSAVLADAAVAVTVLARNDLVDNERIGALGHSMGGHTVLFSAALDERVAFACASGATCGYRARIAAGSHIEPAQLIPDILAIADFDGLAGLIVPRPQLLISASEDRVSFEGPAIEQAARKVYRAYGAERALEHAHYPGGHKPTADRVTRILEWATRAAHLKAP